MANVDLTLLEIEILIYTIDSRGAAVLGPHARSARQKLTKLRQSTLAKFHQAPAIEASLFEQNDSEQEITKS